MEKISIKDDYTARAADFENTSSWKKHIRSVLNHNAIDPEDPDDVLTSDILIRNAYFIRYFTNDMNASSTSLSRNQAKYISIYLNDYLANQDWNAEDGVLDPLLQNFFLEWLPGPENETSVRYSDILPLCETLKSFYSWMTENELIDHPQLEQFIQKVDNNKENWAEQLKDIL